MIIWKHRKILRVGGPENFVILQVSGLENFVILQVGGKVRHPQVIVYGENSVDGWSKKNCNSAGGWSEKSSVVTPTTTFFDGIALKSSPPPQPQLIIANEIENAYTSL